MNSLFFSADPQFSYLSLRDHPSGDEDEDEDEIPGSLHPHFCLAFYLVGLPRLVLSTNHFSNDCTVDSSSRSHTQEPILQKPLML